MAAPGRKIVVRLLAAAALAVGALVAVEGLSSAALLVADLARGPGPLLAERRHTEHDPDLGWSNVPGRIIPDMYGPGKAVTINAQGFRGRRDHPVPAPPGRARIVCSGDSFTFGYGVGDDATWCSLLAALPGNPETVNMGQGGYGVDQSFLWYVRDGLPLRADVLLFAFIREDLERALKDEFLGYPKPLLALRGGRLEVTNVPVPRSASLLPAALRQLRTVQLARQLSAGPARAEGAGLPLLVPAIFGDLAALHQERGTAVVFVYLPTLPELGRDADGVRQWLRELCLMRGWPFVDLSEEMRQLPPGEVERLFIPVGALPEYVAAALHYNEAGHRFVAAALARRLLALPEVAQRLASAGAAAAPTPPARPARP